METQTQDVKPDDIVIVPDELEESSTTNESEEKSDEEVESEIELQKEVDDETKHGQPIIEPKPVDGETPRELALRKETERLRGLLRKEKTSDLFVKKEQPLLSPEDNTILGEYEPEELSRFEKLMEVTAKKMGYVKKGEIEAQTYHETADDVLQNFLKEHKEYLPENDTDGLLWQQFTEEFGLYKQPTRAKELEKIFNRVHENIFGTKTIGDINKIKAQQQKIAVASHAGSPQSRIRHNVVAPQGVDRSYFKGFSDEELKELGL